MARFPRRRTTTLAALGLTLGLTGALTTPARAQAFERTIGAAAEERTEWTDTTNDGGSIHCGFRRGLVPGDDEGIYVTRLDASGNLIWDRLLFGLAFDNANRILQTQDGGFALAGETNGGPPSQGITLIKLGPGGNLQWARTYPGTAFAGGAGGGTAFDETEDGGFVVVGRWQRPDVQQAPVIFRTDANGFPLWHEFLVDSNFGPATFGSFHDVHPTGEVDGIEGYIAAGYLANGSTGSRDALLVRFTLGGNVLWANTYGMPNFTDMGYGVEPAANGDYVMCGYSKAIGEGGGTFVTRVDGGGGLLWWNTYQFFSPTNALEETSTGRLILAGNALDFATYDDPALMQLDPAGNFLWGMRYGGTGAEYGESVGLYSDGYVLSAWTNSFGAGSFDFYAVRTDLTGVTDCNDEPFSPLVAAEDPEVKVHQFETIEWQGWADHELVAIDPDCVNELLCDDDPTVCVDPPDCMVAWLPFDEPVGPVAADLIYGNDGNHANGPVPNLGSYVDNSLCFDETLNQFVRVPDLPALDFGEGDLSIDAWIRTTDVAGVASIVDKRDDIGGGGVQGYAMYLFNGSLAFQLADGSGSNICSCSAAAACTNYISGAFVADGGWHLVAVTVDRDDPNGGVFYVDGAPVATFDPTCRPDSISNTADLWIGGQSYTNTVDYAGCIDEVELFARVLDPTEVAGIYNAGPAGKCKDLCLADFDGDGVVNIGDLIAILSAWGPCPDPCCPFDLNGDRVVNIADLIAALSSWGGC